MKLFPQPSTSPHRFTIGFPLGLGHWSLGFFFLLAVACTQLPALQAEPARPNILFIVSDDQRADAVGAYGNPYIETPHLDRLAHTGLRFTNIYCMGAHHGAVCAPSRAMLMSGKSLYRVCDELEGVTTLPMVLQDAGYRTFATGKWHNGEGPFKAAFHEGQAVFLGGMSDHYRTAVRDLQDDGSFAEPYTGAYSSEMFTDAALRFLQDYADGNRSQPFFAYVSYTAPHDPRSPPADYIGHYGDTDLPLPPNYMDRHPFDIGVMTIRDERLGAWPRSVEQIRMQLADYYAMITHMDAQIGRLVSRLERLGLKDNILIVFTSDHGLAIGSHGLLGKQNVYEHSMKAPLILSGPGFPSGASSEALLYLHDLFPTLCSYLGIPSPKGLDGTNFMPVARQEQPSVRSSLFTTYDDLQRAVRDRRWKLIQYPQINYTQLFDLQSDPYELNNLAQDPAHQAKVQELLSLLQQWQQKTGDTQPLRVEDPAPMAYDLTNHPRRPDRWQPPYTLDRYFEASREP